MTLTSIDLSDVPPQAPIAIVRVSGSVGRPGTLKYKDVIFHVHGHNRHRNKKYQARITIDGKIHSLGYYVNEEEAARVAFKYK